MRVLLDTHAFLWWVEDAPALSKKVKAVIGDPDNECLLRGCENLPPHHAEHLAQRV